MYDATPIVVQSKLSSVSKGSWFNGSSCEVCGTNNASTKVGSVVCNAASTEIVAMKFSKTYTTKHFAFSGKYYKSGQMPTSMSSMTELTNLALNADKFKTSSGTLPSDLSKATKLLNLTVKGVSLIGGIPKLSFGGLALDLSSNSFTGTVPNLKLSDNVTALTLSGNKKSLTFGSSFGLDSAAALTTIVMKNTKLSGPLPSLLFVGGKSALVTVNLASNMLTGNIPTSWDDKSSTGALDVQLQSNKLSGSVPWMQLTTLFSDSFQINLCGNDITGSLNNALCDLGVKIWYIGCIGSAQNLDCSNCIKCSVFDQPSAAPSLSSAPSLSGAPSGAPSVTPP